MSTTAQAGSDERSTGISKSTSDVGWVSCCKDSRDPDDTQTLFSGVLEEVRPGSEFLALVK